MEKKEEKIFRDIVKILEQDVPQEALAEGNPTPEQEAIALIKQELDKAREEGRKSAIHEISKTLDTEVTRWRSDEDGEFDVLRIGFRYFRSTDVDDYSSSIEAISEEDFEDYESI